MIEAVVFDMDGLMIDSQPYWEEALCKFFAQVGLPISRKDIMETTGMRIDQIVQTSLPYTEWDIADYGEASQQMLKHVITLVKQHKPGMPGLSHAIECCQQRGVKLAVASSSPMEFIDATIDVLQLDGVFDVKSSGAGLRYGKPHPEVYLNACHSLGVKPQHCVAIEDSFVGLLAAKAAQMRTIVVPASRVAKEPRYSIADYQLASLQDLTSAMLTEHPKAIGCVIE